MFYQCLENDRIPFQWEEHLKLHFIKIGRGRGGGGGGREGVHSRNEFRLK